MIDGQAVDFLKSEGYLITSNPAFSAKALQDCFRNFVKAEPSYKQRYLQKQFGYGFDGYSYLGQPDSSNQAADDLVSTFVFSNFFDVTRYPPEFQPFLNGDWHQIRPMIQALEISLLKGLNMPKLLNFYQKHIGHMVSNNYYPPLQNFTTTAADHTRLSAHPDVSLFTVFPFGIDGDFEVEKVDEQGQSTWHSIPASETMLLFPGYLMELWSRGTIKALNHRVRLADDPTTERFSFAFFSLPFPHRKFLLPGRGIMTSETYFEAYLALFE